MDKQVPNNLIFSDSALRITYEESSAVNKTNRAIIISGTRGGFLSLANIVLFYVNDLQQEIHLHELPFVESSIYLTIQIDIKTNSNMGDVLAIGNNEFTWKLTEAEVDHVLASIHSLGHINNELHIDNAKIEDEISIYCVVNDD